MKGLTCAVCQQTLQPPQNVVEVFAVYVRPGGSYEYMVDNSFDLAFDPRHFHDACWHEIQNEIYDTYGDVEDRRCPSNSVAVCDICGNGIQETEVIALSRFGELVLSNRCPTSGISMTVNEPRGDKHWCQRCTQVRGRILWNLWDYNTRETQYV